ncbi:MAG TPA: hypothetical protein VM032_16865 [Vicinamibacterales bacterium]|nr:hypothetical protein [Vicinamibacterales bacterium]
MVLTQNELIGALQHEVNILQHLCTKVDASMLDYRPTPKQRSTRELLQYLAVMGPVLVKSALGGGFNQDEWVTRAKAIGELNFEQLVAALGAHAAEYKQLLAGQPDEAFRKDIEMFGNKTTVGAFIVSLVLGGAAAYRTQLFCYLKSCGRDELGTANLWRGVDPAPAQ